MKKKINPIWFALSILLSLAILGLCVFAGRGGTLGLHPNGNPQDVAIYFLNSLVAGEYRSAYACLSDYSALGLENEPQSESARTLTRALRASYGFTLAGDCEQSGLSAVQPVTLRYLDVKAVEDAVAARVEGIAEELVAEYDAKDIYDENGGYLSSFTDEVYATALGKVLADTAGYYSTAELELPLRYLDEAWRLQTTPALISALMGGI